MKKLFNVLRKNIFLIEELLHINSIKKKLISSYLIIIVTMSLFFLFIIVYSFYLNSQYNQVITNFTYYNSIHVPLNKLNKEIYLDISEQKKFNKESLEDEISQINANINAIKYDTNNLEISSEIEILKRTVKSLNNYINDIDVLVSNDTDFKVRQAKQEDITETTTLIKDNIQQLMSFDLNYSQKLIRDIRNGFHIMLIVISISFVLTIIASIIFLLAFTSAIADKIIKISDNANKLAATDLNVEEINFNTNDEFKILAYSFNKMKNNIKEYINQISYNEKRISSILNGMSDCVITTDITGSIMTCNNSTKNVFNYFPSEILGLSINRLIPQINFDKGKNNSLENSELLKKSEIIDGKYQLCGIKKNGKDFPIEVGFSEINLETQKVYIFVIHDITQHKEVEKIKNEFISIVSHELRTPLTSIKGSVELISSEVYGAIPDKIKKLLNIADDNCERLVHLINDILDLEKMISGKFECNIQNHSLSAIIKKSIEENRAFADKYNIKLEFVKVIPEIVVLADQNRLNQVLTNLISNAVKFSNEMATVEISMESCVNTAKVSVKNYGEGISKEFHSKIFQKFQQADSSDTRKKGGTGLGLYICKNLIELMNGKIGFSSEVNKETIFYFELPLVKNNNDIEQKTF